MTIVERDDGTDMRLTKDVRRQLLEKNEGFTTTSNYSGKNFGEHRAYEIRGGELHVLSESHTSWADSRQRSEYVADEQETHRFLYDHLAQLNEEGVDDKGTQSRSSDASDISSHAERTGEAEASNDDGDAESDSSLVPTVVTAALLTGFAAYAAWRIGFKPAIERRQAARDARRAASEAPDERADTELAKER